MCEHVAERLARGMPDTWSPRALCKPSLQLSTESVATRLENKGFFPDSASFPSIQLCEAHRISSCVREGSPGTRRHRCDCMHKGVMMATGSWVTEEAGSPSICRLQLETLSKESHLLFSDQMLAPSRDILTDTPRKVLPQISGHPLAQAG